MPSICSPQSPDCIIPPSLKGNVCVVTGAAGTRIGYETSLELARRGCTTILGCRGAKCEAAASRIRSTCKDCKVHAFQLDVTSPSSVKAFGRAVAKVSKHINVLINNAACANWTFLGERQLLHGFDATLLTNAISPFLVTTELRDSLLRGARRSRTPSVVVTVSSGAHQMGRVSFLQKLAVPPKPISVRSNGFLDYADSKLGNILFAKELPLRTGPDVLSIAYHPGLTRTEIFRSSAWESLWTRLPLFRNPAAPASEIADWVSQAREERGLNGAYVVKKKLRKPSRAAGDTQAAAEFWKAAEEVRSWLQTNGSAQ